MTILAIDTSSEILAIALAQEGKVIAEYSSLSKNKHSKRLMPAVVQLLKSVDIKPKDLKKIVVAKGPGSYTGVRIGLSTAKTLAWTLKIPVVGLSSLEALTLQAQGRNTLICPFFDARRELVYTGLYDQNGQSIIDDQNCLMSDWLEELAKIDQPIIFISPDLDSFKETITDRLGERAIFIAEGLNTTRPGLLALSGAQGKEEDVHQLVPSYLRLVEAEVNWLANQGEQSNE
ncbi:tRNA (adenosine(37)-N6)-threonylcarbamoyltransferase complex dimerization subunit type 1 TsaB [Amphibacillus indicireducens]|uniref:tRNA (Adenosine(37)-N6)-threonylcarbamoyltransferase complex dimerization subunit type 1 TsaB n=1 Tax=Amphibacillus indicireducens TaxID=1076330 RepID=A0ABP7VTY5_9BACI